MGKKTLPRRNKSALDRYASCRAWGHRWYSVDVTSEGGKYLVYFNCNKCGADRYHKLDAQGYILSRSYVYPEDYLLEGGVPSQADRARLRLAAMASM
jgi:hypothetical protein